MDNDSAHVPLAPPNLLQALKLHGNFYVDEGLKLPTATPFGNLNLSYWDIVVRIDYLNSKIIDLFSQFEGNRQKRENPTKPYIAFDNEPLVIKHKIEEITYWLRKIADEIISLFYILNYVEKHGTYPTKIMVSSIGDLLHKSEVIENYDIELKKHKSVLETVRQVSNGYKHSFINQQLNPMHSDEYPLLLALRQHQNDQRNTSVFHDHKLNDVLLDYNSFLKTIHDLLLKNYKEVK